MNDDVAGLLERLSKRLANASPGDRMYERPMSWNDADALLAAIRALVAENEGLKFGDKQMQGLWACDREERDKAEAKLREAVELMRSARDFCETTHPDGWGIDVVNKLETFLTTMGKPNG